MVLEASAASLCVAAHLARGGGLGEAAVQLLAFAAVIVGAEAGDGLEPGRFPGTILYTSARRVRACLEPSPVLLLTGIEAASGTNIDSMRSETPYDDSAKAEQPRPIATVRKMHSSFDVEQDVLPKRRPERVEGVVDDGGASSTDALPEPTPARSSLSTDALPEPTTAARSSTWFVELPQMSRQS